MAAVDPNLPMELDNGDPVELVQVQDAKVYVRVKNPMRNQKRDYPEYGAYFYYLKNGMFGGGDPKTYLVLRNVEDDPSLYVPDLV